MKKLRILIMNRKYDGTVGGVERMSTLLASEMSERGHECHIVSLDRPDAKMYFPLSPNVQWHRIAETEAQVKASWQERFKRFLKIRSIMKDHKIDVAIGFQDGAYLSLLTSSIGTVVSVIAAERNSPSRFDYLRNKNMKHFVFNIFRFARFVTIQCAGYKKLYPEFLQDKIRTISNPVQPAKVTIQPKAPDSIKTLLFAGRLDYQKNAGVLVDAFAMIAAQFPTWRLLLIGNGPDREMLEKKISAHRLGHQIQIENARENIETAYIDSDLFCLPSYWEGFPNTLAEAMAHGLPSVGFKNCAGVNELINDNVTGLLADGINNKESLSQALARLMEDDSKRNSMSLACVQSMKQYAPEIVFNQWEELLVQSAG